MKDIAQIIAAITTGSIFLFFAAICPLPAMLAVPGVTWRIIIGALGVLLLARGICKAKGCRTKEV